MSFLTIIVPVYNKINFLDSCLNSILGQTFSDFELILVNDGSTDGSLEKCLHYKEVDNRIIVINQANEGVSKARNNGLFIAHGKYVGFIDADDTIEKDMFAILVANALKIDADISICNLRILENENSKITTTNVLKIEILSKNDTLSALLRGTINWSANNKIYKRELASQIKFEGKINEDLWFCFNVINAMNGIAIFSNEEKYNYIKRDNSVSLTGFSSKQMESVIVSKKILNIVTAHFKIHINEARFLDFVSNLSILNLIILGNQSKNEEYNIVSKNLHEYKPLLNQLDGLSKKQVYAFKVFIFSPTLYRILLKFYCMLFPSEAGKKVL